MTDWETTYYQTLEAVRFLARTSTLNTLEILNHIHNDIVDGKYENTDIPNELKFWQKN